MIRFYSLFTATLVAAALAAGCASSNKPAPAAEAPPPPPPPAAKAKAAPAREAAPAAKRGAASGGKIAAVTVGMGEMQVREILGPPDNEQTYQTGKGYIPGYVGSDVARTEWIYHGQGRIVLVRNRWSGKLKVTRVDNDPNL